MIRKHACPKGYRYYYVDCDQLLGRSRDGFLDCEVYKPVKGWQRDRMHEISDRLIGYDPYEEDPGWRIWNADIMEEIREISRADAKRILRKQRHLMHSGNSQAVNQR